MWRDYLGYIGAALAVLNALIATFIARLPDRRSVYRLRLGVTALVIGAIAVGTAIYSQHAFRVRLDRQQADRVEIRKRIENFSLEGRGLLDQIKDPQHELPARTADEWAQRTEIFLRSKLGERYIARFRKEPGPLYGDDTTIPAARLGYWRAVRNRVIILDMIGAEFGEPPPLRR
jgi:hypothetical protein